MPQPTRTPRPYLLATLALLAALPPVWPAAAQQITDWKRDPVVLRDANGQIVERRQKAKLPTRTAVEQKLPNGLLRFRDGSGTTWFVSEYDVQLDVTAARTPTPPIYQERGKVTVGGTGLGR